MRARHVVANSNFVENKRVALNFHINELLTRFAAVKQRMQKFKSTYKSSWHCSKSMWKEEGVRSFYRSYGTQICMNIPQQCVHFMAYERIKRHLNPTNEYR